MGVRRRIAPLLAPILVFLGAGCAGAVQEADVREPPGDLEAIRAIVEALPSYEPEIAAMRLYIDVRKTDRASPSDSGSLVQPSRRPDGADAPSAPALEWADCTRVRRLSECGIDVGEAVLWLNRVDRRGPEGEWMVFFHIGYPLNERGDLGGGSFIARLDEGGGGWGVTDIQWSGVF